MWDLSKILAATPTVEEAAAERPIFRLDPMIEARVFLLIVSKFLSRNLGHTFIRLPGGSGERGGAEVNRAEQGEIIRASEHLVHTGRNTANT